MCTGWCACTCKNHRMSTECSWASIVFLSVRVCAQDDVHVLAKTTGCPLRLWFIPNCKIMYFGKKGYVQPFCTLTPRCSSHYFLSKVSDSDPHSDHRMSTECSVMYSRLFLVLCIQDFSYCFLCSCPKTSPSMWVHDHQYCMECMYWWCDVIQYGVKFHEMCLIRSIQLNLWHSNFCVSYHGNT